MPSIPKSPVPSRRRCVFHLGPTDLGRCVHALGHAAPSADALDRPECHRLVDPTVWVQLEGAPFDATRTPAWIDVDGFGNVVATSAVVSDRLVALLPPASDRGPADEGPVAVAAKRVVAPVKLGPVSVLSADLESSPAVPRSGCGCCARGSVGCCCGC